MGWRGAPLFAHPQALGSPGLLGPGEGPRTGNAWLRSFGKARAPAPTCAASWCGCGRQALSLQSEGSRLAFGGFQVDVVASLNRYATRAYTEALHLWRGAPGGRKLADAPEFEEWLELTRAQLAQRYEDALLAGAGAGGGRGLRRGLGLAGAPPPAQPSWRRPKRRSSGSTPRPTSPPGPWPTSATSPSF